jgi:hypothetical protein
VLDKYASRGLVILSINVETDEDSLVLPFLRNNKYGFIPLKGNRDWAKNVYKVVGTPTNFLLDGQGRVIFKPRPYDAETERTLELEIEALLK